MTINPAARTPIAVLATSAALLAGSISASADPDPAHHEATHQAPAGMSVQLTTKPAPGGVLVRLKTRGLTWAPEHMSPVHGKGRYVPGEGHGHIYVDGAKQPATMVVGPWTYLKLAPGRHTLRAALNGNDHLGYRRNGRAVQDVERVLVATAAEMEG